MRRALVIGAAAGALLMTTALPVAAAVNGGWASSTLDEAPQAAPGEDTEIGFTILQHGRTPVNVDDVAVVIRVDGDEQVSPAVQEGEVGHYVADVTFPPEGEYDWAIRQGWFGDFELGRLRVGGVDAAGAAASDGWWDSTPWALKVVLALPILASAGLFVLDRSRRRRPVDRPDEPIIAGA
jgi:hypothetical protein